MRRQALAAVMAVVTAVVLAACGGSSSSSAGGSAAEWTIGSIGSCSGSQAGSVGGTCKTMEAWAASVNAAGGINGHKINLIVKDDQNNPATSNTLARQLVAKDHVIAIVGDNSDVDAGWAPYVQAKGVPVLGGLGSNTPFLSNPDYFGIGTNLFAVNYAVTSEAAKRGLTKVGFLYCAESPLCAQSVPAFQAAAKLTGVTAIPLKVSATAPDYTAPCLQLKNAGVQAMEIGSGSDTILRVLDACAAQGLKATLIQTDGTLTNNWVKDKNTEGTVGVELVAPWFDTSIPAIQQYQAAMKKYAPDVLNSALFGPATTYAWTSGQLFEAAAKAGNLGDKPTSADVLKGLYALKGETLGGLTAPLTYTKGQVALNSCYFPVAIKGGQFTAPNGATPTCMPQDKLGQLFKAVGS